MTIACIRLDVANRGEVFSVGHATAGRTSQHVASVRADADRTHGGVASATFVGPVRQRATDPWTWAAYRVDFVPSASDPRGSSLRATAAILNGVEPLVPIHSGASADDARRIAIETGAFDRLARGAFDFPWFFQQWYAQTGKLVPDDAFAS